MYRSIAVVSDELPTSFSQANVRSPDCGPVRKAIDVKTCDPERGIAFVGGTVTRRYSVYAEYTPRRPGRVRSWDEGRMGSSSEDDRSEMKYEICAMALVEECSYSEPTH